MRGVQKHSSSATSTSAVIVRTVSVIDNAIMIVLFPDDEGEGGVVASQRSHEYATNSCGELNARFDINGK